MTFCLLFSLYISIDDFEVEFLSAVVRWVGFNNSRSRQRIWYVDMGSVFRCFAHFGGDVIGYLLYIKDNFR